MKKEEIFESKFLQGELSIGVIVPEKIERVMLLLHGYKERFSDMDKNLPLEEFANSKNMLIVCPDTNDEYYIPKDNYRVDEFVKDELMPWITDKYQLDESVRWHIAGISMGGYGSLLLAALLPHVFKSIIIISGAFIAHDVAIGNPQIVGDSKDLDSWNYYSKTFAPFDTLEEDHKRNPVKAAIMNIGFTYRPKIIATCGKEDPLFDRYLETFSKLLKNNVSCEVYFIKDGKHDYDCFEKGLRYALDIIK